MLFKYHIGIVKHIYSLLCNKNISLKILEYYFCFRSVKYFSITHTLIKHTRISGNSKNAMMIKAQSHKFEPLYNARERVCV